jgi:hypothetical protein
MRMFVENTDDQTTADPGLLKIVARAHDIKARPMPSTDLTVRVIARQERVSGAYVYRLLRLSSLAPDIITAIINGKNPPQLTAKKLMLLTPQIPVDWTEQRKLLGFSITTSRRFGRQPFARSEDFFSARRHRPPTHHKKEVNLRKPPGRLSCRPRPRSDAESSLPHMASAKRRKTPDFLANRTCQTTNIKYLGRGWGTRIRT